VFGCQWLSFLWLSQNIMLMLKGGRANSGIVNELLAVMMHANVCLTEVEEHESRMAYHLLSL